MVQCRCSIRTRRVESGPRRINRITVSCFSCLDSSVPTSNTQCSLAPNPQTCSHSYLWTRAPSSSPPTGQPIQTGVHPQPSSSLSPGSPILKALRPYSKHLWNLLPLLHALCWLPLPTPDQRPPLSCLQQHAPPLSA